MAQGTFLYEIHHRYESYSLNGDGIELEGTVNSAEIINFLLL